MAAPRDRVLNALSGICRVLFCVCGRSLNSSRGELMVPKFFTSGCVLYLVSCILYLISCILYLVSFILYLLSCILYLVSYILYLIFYILSLNPKPLLLWPEGLALTPRRPWSSFFLPFDSAKVRKIMTRSKYFSNYFYIKWDFFACISACARSHTVTQSHSHISVFQCHRMVVDSFNYIYYILYI